MTEPHMISIDQAKLLMSAIDPDQPPIRKDWDDHLVHKLAATVIAQAEQIKRLQEAVDALIAEKQAHAEIRKRIEERIRELRQPLCSHMPEGDELDDYLEQWGRQSHEAEILTRILEADNE